MEPGGAGHTARNRVMDLSAKVKAAMAEGGSSHSDLHRLINSVPANVATKLSFESADTNSRCLKYVIFL
jgi:hypothetical protein